MEMAQELDKRAEALEAHKKWQGKIEVTSRARLETMADLAVA